MSKNKHLGLLIDPETHYKLHYMAKYEGRSGNGEVLYLIRQAVFVCSDNSPVSFVPELINPTVPFPISSS